MPIVANKKIIGGSLQNKGFFPIIIQLIGG